MQGGLVLRPAEPDAGAYEQREQTDAGEHQIEPVRARRYPGNGDDQELGVPVSRDDVFEAGSRAGGVQRLDHIVGTLHELLVDPEENVTRLDASTARRRVVGNDAGHDVAAIANPENAVFHLRPALDADVERRQDDEANDHGDLGGNPHQRGLVDEGRGLERRHREVRPLRSKGRSLSNNDFMAINHCPAITSMLKSTAASNYPDR